MESLGQRAKKEILSADYLPNPSPILFELIGLLQDEDADAQDYKSLLDKDPALCSQILKMANSAYYGCRGQVADLERAIVIIGFNELKNICFTVALLHNFSTHRLPKEFDHKLFWEHSLLVAILSKEMGAQTRAPWNSTNQYYTMGLLHDLGRLALAAYLPDYFQQIIRKTMESGSSLYETEKELGLTHTQMGFWLASRWGFPREICQVVSCHHAPTTAKNFVRDTTLVYLADRMAKYAQDPENQPVPLSDPALLNAAGLSGEQFEKHLDGVFDLLSDVEGLYGALSGNK